MSELATIYMKLLGEGADVWRPVQAERIAPDIYLVLGPVPEDEEWAFPPGNLVRCAERALSGDHGRRENWQVAVARVAKDDVAR
jgi:hypothetical protein